MHAHDQSVYRVDRWAGSILTSSLGIHRCDLVSLQVVVVPGIAAKFRSVLTLVIAARSVSTMPVFLLLMVFEVIKGAGAILTVWNRV